MEQPQALMAQPRFYLLATLCAIAVGLFYCAGLGGDFLVDDRPTITYNEAVHVTSLDADALAKASYSFYAGNGTRVLPMLTFALDHWRAGLDPTAFKTTNIIIHGLTTLVLAGFLRLLLSMAGWPPRRAAWAALAMTLAWALHPLLVSSVLYIVQRMQTMATLFLLLALGAYLKARQAQIEGRASRLHWILLALAWALALACKEDAVLLPAYALLLELSVLHFRANNATLTNRLRKGYLLASIIAATLFAFVVVPHYWSWEPLAFRDFSTPDRLWTQARVLIMHLGQILYPMPSHMPFFYDGLQPSRGLLQPVSTLLSFLLLGALLAVAWLVRLRRPLFTLGIGLFFAGHFVSSNVIGLELVFEHRNHLPLIGIVIAMTDLILASADRLRLAPRTTIVIAGALLALLTFPTAIRLDTWGKDSVGFAEMSTQINPGSERAWAMLCQGYHDRSGGDIRHPDFVRAIDACEQGTLPPHGITNLANVVVLKSDLETVTPEDWLRLLERLPKVAMTPDNIGAVWYLVKHAHRNPRIDEHNTLRLIDAVSERANFDAMELASLGFFIASKPALQQHAYRYYALAVARSPEESPLASQLIADLEAQGRQDWAENLRKIPQQGTATHAGKD